MLLMGTKSLIFFATPTSTSLTLPQRRFTARGLTSNPDILLTTIMTRLITFVGVMFFDAGEFFCLEPGKT